MWAFRTFVLLSKKASMRWRDSRAVGRKLSSCWFLCRFLLINRPRDWVRPVCNYYSPENVISGWILSAGIMSLRQRNVEYEPRNGGRLCVATTTYYSMPTTSSCDMFPRRAKSNHIRDCHNDCKKRNLFSSITASEEKMQFSMAKVIKLDIDHQFSPFPSITNGVYGATIPSSQILLIYG
jgi:hypothetical protein